MSIRKFKLAKGGQVTACPRCGNDIEFIARSEQVAEDCCDTWVECTCGYDPTHGKVGHRYEDVWGGCDTENITMALSVWNDEMATA